MSHKEDDAIERQKGCVLVHDGHFCTRQIITKWQLMTFKRNKTLSNKRDAFLFSVDVMVTTCLLLIFAMQSLDVNIGLLFFVYTRGVFYYCYGLILCTNMILDFISLFFLLLCCANVPTVGRMKVFVFYFTSSSSPITTQYITTRKENRRFQEMYSLLQKTREKSETG